MNDNTPSRRWNDQLPPHNLSAERCLLGSLMLSGGEAAAFSRIHCVISDIGSEVFFDEDHRMIYDAISSTWNKRRTLDAVLVGQTMSDSKTIDKVGGVQSLIRIINAVPSAANGAHYAKIVKQLWLRRKTGQLAGELLRLSYSQADESPVLAKFDELEDIFNRFYLTNGTGCDNVSI